jgi:hypothetical protein
VAVLAFIEWVLVRLADHPQVARHVIQGADNPQPERGLTRPTNAIVRGRTADPGLRFTPV